jgi:hypothetical protein
VSIRVSEAELRRRLTERWQSHCIAPEEILAKVEANDLPNGRTILAHSIPGDFVLET